MNLPVAQPATLFHRLDQHGNIIPYENKYYVESEYLLMVGWSGEGPLPSFEAERMVSIERHKRKRKNQKNGKATIVLRQLRQQVLNYRSMFRDKWKRLPNREEIRAYGKAMRDEVDGREMDGIRKRIQEIFIKRAVLQRRTKRLIFQNRHTRRIPKIREVSAGEPVQGEEKVERHQHIKMETKKPKGKKKGENPESDDEVWQPLIGSEHDLQQYAVNSHTGEIREFPNIPPILQTGTQFSDFLDQQRKEILTHQTAHVIASLGEYPEMNSLPGRKIDPTHGVIVFYNGMWMKPNEYNRQREVHRKTTFAANVGEAKNIGQGDYVRYTGPNMTSEQVDAHQLQFQRGRDYRGLFYIDETTTHIPIHTGPSSSTGRTQKNSCFPEIGIVWRIGPPALSAPTAWKNKITAATELAIGRGVEVCVIFPCQSVFYFDSKNLEIVGIDGKLSETGWFPTEHLCPREEKQTHPPGYQHRKRPRRERAVRRALDGGKRTRKRRRKRKTRKTRRKRKAIKKRTRKRN